MPQAGSRKRAAPGASPTIYSQPQMAQTYVTNSSQIPNNQFLQWNQDNTVNGAPSYPDPTESVDPKLYQGMTPQGKPLEPSSQLTRRPTNQHMVSQSPYVGGPSDSWPGMVERASPQPREKWNNEEQKMTQKAALAKKEALEARKTIPPFVQKLRSFLDEDRNTDLIRWSSSGKSFVVLDEDEFARTLIPEFFKHKNYASFVRQLNMYGFHKKVGLSDNSMRQSEKKTKSPSEYHNPHFQKGRPDLLWLIQKPKPSQGKGKGGSRAKTEDAMLDLDGDEIYDAESGVPINSISEDNTGHRGGAPLMIAQGPSSLPQEDLSAVHQELQAIRQQQQIISGVISKIRREHEQLYGQAAAFQELHNRHENSINAILTFLATIYNRSLEGHGTQNLANLFAGAIPHDPQQQGSVVDVGDYTAPESEIATAPIRRPLRRQPLLLKAPPPSGQDGGGHISTASTPGPSVLSPTQRSQTRSSARNNAHAPSNYESPSSAALSNRSSESPQFSADQGVNDQLPERDILSLINSANANDNTPFRNRMDFPEALSHLQTVDGQSPLTPNQRNQVLQIMANGTGNAASNRNNNNALVSPNPPDLPTPDIERWNTTRDQLDFLEKTLREQDSKVANLSSMLGPLSPSGSVPGLTDSQGYVPGNLPPDPLDFDNMINTDQIFNNDYNFGDMDSSGDFGFEPTPDYHNDGNTGDEFDFDGPGTGFDGMNRNDTPSLETPAHRLVEALNSSVSTSPAATVEDEVEEAGDRNPTKRRRRD